MTPEPVFCVTGKLVDYAASSVNVGEEDDDMVDTEDE